MINYFIDTEFIENGKTIDLISIAIVKENNQYLYLINRDCDFSKADDWVLQNVLLPMGLDRRGFTLNPGDPSVSPAYRESFMRSMTKSAIAREVRGFVKEQDVRFWANFGHYDMVALCQLFGKMIDLPKDFPFFCNELQQLIEEKERLNLLTREELPKQKHGNHNALEDARYVKKVYEYIRQREFDREK